MKIDEIVVKKLEKELVNSVGFVCQCSLAPTMDYSLEVFENMESRLKNYSQKITEISNESEVQILIKKLSNRVAQRRYTLVLRKDALKN